jgi:PAS domain S-box-containing protein
VDHVAEHEKELHSRPAVHTSAVIALTLGTLVSLCLAGYTLDRVIDGERRLFTARVFSWTSDVETRLGVATQFLESLPSLYYASDGVNADEFRLFTRDVLAGNKSILSVAYLPMVDTAADTDGAPTTPCLPTRSLRYDALNTCFPVLYSQPPAEPTAVWREADAADLQAAVSSAVEQAGSSAVILPPTATHEGRILLLRAVYSGRYTPFSTHSRRRGVSGIVMVAVDPGLLLDPGDELVFEQLSMSTGDTLIAQRDRAQHPDAVNFALLSEERPIRAADRNLTLHAQRQLSSDSLSFTLPVLSLLVGMFLTGAVIAWQLSSAARADALWVRNREIARMVAERTTALQETSTALEEGRRFLDTISNNMGEGIYVLDPEGRVSFINPEAERLLGVTKAELGDRPLYECISLQSTDGQPVDLRQSAVYKSMEELRNHRTNDEILVRGDGSTLPVSVTAAPFVDDTGVRGCIAVVSDITEQTRAALQQQELIEKLQQAKEQLVQSEKMASIGQLAAGVAHEINNPVGFVYSNLGTLQRYLEDFMRMLDAHKELARALPADDEKVLALKALEEELEIEYLRDDLPQLVTESKDGLTRVKQIVQDLKDFSHSGDKNWHWTDLHTGLDSTLNIVHNELKYKAEVIREYGEIPEIECIASQLNQVFMNLLVNAGHAIEERGTVTVRTGMEDADHVKIEIEDNGKGIEPENLRRIFDPFFSTKAVGKGTGLGLSLSYGIVAKHGGRIDVQSQAGTGTTFRVILPVRQDERAESEPQPLAATG